MMNQTWTSQRFEDVDRVMGVTRQFLTVGSDADIDNVYYRAGAPADGEDIHPPVSLEETADPSQPAQVPRSPGQGSQAPPEPNSSARVDVPQPRLGPVSQHPDAGVEVDSILVAIVASKLKRKSEEIQKTATIRSLVGGKIPLVTIVLTKYVPMAKTAYLERLTSADYPPSHLCRPVNPIQ